MLSGQRAVLAGVCLLVVVLLQAALAWAAEAPQGANADACKGTSSRAGREDAIASIPFEKLSPEAQALVSSVLSNVTMFRRLPVRVIQCDPDLYLFLVQRPDVTVAIWEILGVSKLSMEQAGPGTFRLADEAGTKATVTFLYSKYDTHLIYCDGVTEGPLLGKPVRSRTLLLLKSGYVREVDGRFYITCRMDVFIQMDDVGAELLTKTLQPMVNNAADTNFTQTAAFFSRLSRTAEANPQGVQRLAGRLTKVPPEVRDQLAGLAVQVAQRALAQKTPLGDEPSPMAEQPRTPLWR